MKKITNVSLQDFRGVLRQLGLVLVRTTGGHEFWTKAGLPRPVVVQTHIEPIPLHIIMSNLHTLGLSKQEFMKFLESTDKR